MASRREIKLSETWKPTSLIAVINMRKDLSDADKVRYSSLYRVTHPLDSYIVLH